MNNGKQTYGVIFDMDGVLVESYKPHFESWRAAAREYGYDITEEQFAHEFGRTSREIIHDIWGQDVDDNKIHEIDDLKENIYRDLIRKDVPATPGLYELLQELLDNKAKMAVGSSGPIENINLVLDSLKIRKYFSAIVSAKDVKKGKPDPQVFQLASERIAVDSSRCLVIEDAVPGIKAAHNAGMKVIALTTSHRAEKLSEADSIVKDLSCVTFDAIRNLFS